MSSRDYTPFNLWQMRNCAGCAVPEPCGDSKFIASTGQVSLDVLMKYVESQNEPKVKK